MSKRTNSVAIAIIITINHYYYHLITLSPYHLITLSPYQLITLSPYHLITLSPYHLINLSPYHQSQSPITITITNHHHQSPSPITNHHHQSPSDFVDFEFNLVLHVLANNCGKLDRFCRSQSVNLAKIYRKS